MGLDASGWSLDIGERIGVASVNEEGAREVSLGNWGVRDWKVGSENFLTGWVSDSRNSSAVSTS